MNHSTSDLSMPADRGGLPWSGCQRCRRRADCPYLCRHASAEALYSAVCQERAADRLLRAEADRLQEAVSQAGDVDQLLRADEGLERVLAQALRSELAILELLF